MPSVESPVSRGAVLVLDDERDICEFVADVGSDLGFRTQWCDNFEDFAWRYAIDLRAIFLDLAMPDMDGVQIIRFLGDNQSGAHLVLMSGYDSGVIEAARRLAEACGLKVAAVLQKPFGVTQLSEVYELLATARDPLPPGVAERPAESHRLDAAALSLALDAGHVVPYFQPKVCVASGIIEGAEVLARWIDPEYGMIGPDRFIPLAEREGLIDRLTDSMIVQALGQCRIWREHGVMPRIAFNLSPLSLRRLELPDALLGMANAHGMPPEQITMEITEAALMSDFSASLDVLTRLRMRKFGLSIDDFGTGYSSMKQLQLGPFTELKVDQSFIAKALTEETAWVIVESSVQLGHRLGLRVVAEGIETQEQMEMARRLGCEEAQGFLLGRPCPAGEFLWPRS